MLIAICHNAVADDAPADERDVLVQVDVIANALARLGHEPYAVPVTLDLNALQTQIETRRPDIAFNLVEALGGTDRLCPAVPILLEAAGVPFTGNGADALYVTSSKRLTKQRLGEVGIPTPASVSMIAGTPYLMGATEEIAFPGRYLLKAVHEHASFGMDDDAVFDAAVLDDVVAAIARQKERYGKPFFAEQYIEGREFNLSVLGGQANQPSFHLRKSHSRHSQRASLASSATQPSGMSRASNTTRRPGGLIIPKRTRYYSICCECSQYEPGKPSI